MFSIHQMLAIAVGDEDFGLDEAEAKQLAKAFVDMQRHYSTIASAKTLDTMRFVMVAGTIYGSRVVKLAKAAGEKRSKKAAPGNVQVLRPVSP